MSKLGQLFSIPPLIFKVYLSFLKLGRPTENYALIYSNIYLSLPLASSIRFFLPHGHTGRIKMLILNAQKAKKKQNGSPFD